jgi:hypothetical protein
MKTVANAIGRADATIPDDPGVAARTVILLNPPGDAFGAYVTARRVASHRPRPKRLRWLATGASPLTLERVDARTLRVTPVGGFYSRLSERMLRSLTRPFLVGELVSLNGLTVEIESLTPDGRPARVRATFDASLDGDDIVMLRWDLCGYVPQKIPAVGDRVVLPAVRTLAALLGGRCRPDGTLAPRGPP